LFASVTVAPGLIPDQTIPSPLLSLPVTVIVGENDNAWRTDVEQLAKRINSAGGKAQLQMVRDAGHTAFERVPDVELERYLLRR
jgi:pimeloyl-ACP methyl ester carboxylesterase